MSACIIIMLRQFKSGYFRLGRFISGSFRLVHLSKYILVAVSLYHVNSSFGYIRLMKVMSVYFRIYQVRSVIRLSDLFRLGQVMSG